jgi:GNAT superfamily N-acetyltransferase
MYFNELGVAEEARRNGVATALVEALIATAREAGRHRM